METNYETPKRLKLILIKDNKECDGKNCGTVIRKTPKKNICAHNNLLVTHPELCKQWDYEKNEHDPSYYSKGSNTKVFWVCPDDPCGCHKYDAIISNKTRKNAGCKFCNRNEVCPHNNFLITHPELCKQWDYEKNIKGPENYTHGSNLKVHWICPNNPCGCHKYEVSINSRTSMNSGCKFCNSGYACLHNNLTITHPDLCKQWDYEKNEKGPENYTAGSGIKVHWICPLNPCGCHNYFSKIVKRTKDGRGCKFCNHGVACLHNNLVTTHPELCKQWDYEKNEKGPENYTYGSHSIVYWICPLNPCGCHKYQMVIYCKTIDYQGCNYCGLGLTCPHNNLTITHPELCKQWDYEKNEKGPENYTYGSSAKVYWICPINPCGCHKYLAKILDRTYKQTGCKFCNKGSVCPHNNLTITHPSLCKQWDYDKNTSNAETYTYGSNKIVFWLCNKNHSYELPILYRTNQMMGCPLCITSGYSKISIEWINCISEKENIHIQCATNDGEYKIEGIGKVDGYCQETNTVYEFHGDFWHGNPLIFDSEDINPVNCIKYGDLYNKTIKRDELIISKGYNLVTMWENDYKKQMKKGKLINLLT
jgi:hypothetical protein